MRLARLLRSILAAEAVFYVLVGVWLHTVSGMGAGAVLAVLIVLALLGRATYVGGAYALARRYDSGCEPALGVPRLARLFLGELAAFTWTHTVVQPFLPWTRRWLPPDTGQGGLPPVLFVHGYCCNEGFWLTTRRALFRRGIRWQAGISLEPLFGSIDAYAEPLHERVEALRRRSGADRVVIVAHSMGGLAARAYLRRFGGDRIAHLITVGTPHHGSALARLAWGRNAREMEPDSPWLTALNADRSTRDVPVTAILSSHDQMVSPRRSATLEDARVVTLEGVGHLSLGLSPAVRGHIYRVLEDVRDRSEPTGSSHQAF